MRGLTAIAATLLAALPAMAATATLTVEPVKAHIGDAIKARLSVTPGADETVDVTPLDVSWGPAQVLSGGWEPATAGSSARVWSGSIALYALGPATIPPIVVPISKAGTPASVATEPVSIEIEGTLPSEQQGEKPPDLIDLKAPASIPPDYGPLKRALGAFAALLVGAAVAWWLWRRYASRLAAVSAPIDPFRKLPPHVWVYEELEKLLARRLAEEGKTGLFYDELTRIVKQYLEGRFRVDLLERTTSEVPAALLGAGAPADAGHLARALLESGDRVKFARVPAGPADCRAAVEEAYRLVDMTKPVEVVPGPETAAVEAVR
jgi:hypothetical protein